MIRPKQKWFYAAGLLTLTAAVTQLFINCGKFSSLDLSSVSSRGLMPADHPAADKPSLPKQTMQLAHRGYVSKLFNEIFSGADANANRNLSALVQTWVGNQGAQFGLGCNLYEIYSAKDCGGDIANTNLPINRDDNIVRESMRLRSCDEILSRDEYLRAALAKLEPAVAAPNPQAIEQMVDLFYRIQRPRPAFFSELSAMDSSLAKTGVSDLQRWRMLSIMICESPDWQLL